MALLDIPDSYAAIMVSVFLNISNVYAMIVVSCRFRYFSMLRSSCFLPPVVVFVSFRAISSE